MKERPIIFSTQMVRAILSGAKIQTRRVIPVLPKRGYSLHQISGDKFCFRKVHKNGDATHSDIFRRPCDVGDLLWVRETFVGPIYDDIDDPYSDDDFENPDHCIYKADKDETPEYVDMDDNIRRGWIPSILMPRWASRISLLVKSVRADPLKEISDEDAIREGIYKSICISKRCPFYIGECWDGNERLLAAGVPRLDFETLWRSLYPDGQKSWGANPWVWVIDFDVVKRP